jgi:hypothetical protein
MDKTHLIAEVSHNGEEVASGGGRHGDTWVRATGYKAECGASR